MPTTTADSAAPPVLDFTDIQANILRGYSGRRARHFALAVTQASEAATFLRTILPDAPGDGPHITTASVWSQKPPYCLNVGFTWPGLKAMGLPDSLLALFPVAFQKGPGAPADKVTQMGDTGESDPANWILGGSKSPAVHLILSAYTHASEPGPLEALSDALVELFRRYGMTIVWQHDAAALHDGTVHFGYKDGIAQPRIEGVESKQLPDMQPECKAGEFLLGKNYRNQYDGNFLGDLPNALGDNACYGAFRLLRQDVAAFERLLERTSSRSSMDQEMVPMDKEMVAAKLMGRWRNGMPLVMTPTTPNPTPHIHDGQINHFDYAPTPEHNTYFDDTDGMRCPVGSHMRRLNPRGAMAMGQPHSRRIIRRGIAYGPPYDPSQGDDGKERGLVGYFLCGDLAMQFEFMLGTWANDDLAMAGLRGTVDPILGAQPHGGGTFVIRTNDSRDPIVVNNVPRLVTTRGSVYCLLPGIGGLRFIAAAAAAT